jgi:peptide-methionine (S)-S-oxide reductase
MMKKATLGAGCFWCIEACFKDITGVEKVSPGYMGGDPKRANYHEVCKGDTGHAEVAHIEYNDEVLSFPEILKMFWFVHDPTQLNRQGGDIGEQYRSVIFYHDDEQESIAEQQRDFLNNEGVWEKPIVTQIVPAEEFYAAEAYHHNYLENNPENPYCQSVVRPKVDKFRMAFETLLK